MDGVVVGEPVAYPFPDRPTYEQSAYERTCRGEIVNNRTPQYPGHEQCSISHCRMYH